MRIPMLVRWHLYDESGAGFLLMGVWSKWYGYVSTGSVRNYLHSNFNPIMTLIAGHKVLLLVTYWQCLCYVMLLLGNGKRQIHLVSDLFAWNAGFTRWTKTYEAYIFSLKKHGKAYKLGYRILQKALCMKMKLLHALRNNLQYGHVFL